MPNNDLFTNDVMTFRLNEIYQMSIKGPFCEVVLFVILNHKICLVMFAICTCLNEKVTTTSYSRVNITNQIKINKTRVVYLKSVMSTYCILSKWWVVYSFLS